MTQKANGAQGRNRTTDTRIFSPLLYRLSYLGDGPQSYEIPLRPSSVEMHRGAIGRHQRAALAFHTPEFRIASWTSCINVARSS